MSENVKHTVRCISLEVRVEFRLAGRRIHGLQIGFLQESIDVDILFSLTVLQLISHRFYNEFKKCSTTFYIHKKKELLTYL